jgi:hypothetical protein
VYKGKGISPAIQEILLYMYKEINKHIIYLWGNKYTIKAETLNKDIHKNLNYDKKYWLSKQTFA